MEDVRLVFMGLSLKYVRLVFHPPYNKLKFILITRVLDGIVRLVVLMKGSDLDDTCEISVHADILMKRGCVDESFS